MERLVGEWEWVLTEEFNGYQCYGTVNYTPQSEGYTYSLKFESKGILRLYKNGECQKKYRLVEDHTQEVVPNEFYRYSFKLNNKKSDEISFMLRTGPRDSLFNFRFPIEITSDCLWDRQNILLRK